MIGFGDDWNSHHEAEMQRIQARSKQRRKGGKKYLNRGCLPWCLIPEEIQVEIFEYLAIPDFRVTSCVSRETGRLTRFVLHYLAKHDLWGVYQVRHV